jgi:KDO2-lipid IV(A) lauroyltransferase
MVSMHSDSDCNGWSVNFSPILENFPSGDDLADACRINEMLETQIRVHPTQYLWVHRRFKTRPEGQAKVY